MPLLKSEMLSKALRPWVARAVRWCTIIGLLLGGLALTGCSAIRLGYNNAPNLAAWWLDGYLDFDTAQTARLKADLQALQNWHRKDELPLLADMLKNLQAAAEQPVTPEQVCSLTAYIEARVQAVADRAAPTALAIAPTLQTAQLEHLVRAWDKRNREWREEWLDGAPSERLDRRLKKAVERAEDFYGRLSDTQVAKLRSQIDQSPFDPAIQYREALARQQDTLQTLRTLQNANDLQTQAEIRALIARAFKSPDPAFRQYIDNLREQGCSAAADFHNTTSAAQRSKFKKVLQDYEADARALMVQR